MTASGIIQIPVGASFITIVDEADVPLVAQRRWTPCADHDGIVYARAHISGRRVLLHNLLIQPPPGLEADHINRNGLDNRRSNLRLATRSQNLANRGRPKNNTSGFKGACYHKNSGKWLAQIKVNGRRIYLGQFLTAADAGRAYDEAATRYFGEFACLNFPRGTV